MKAEWCYKKLGLLKGAFLRMNKCITVVIKEQLSLSALLCIFGMNSYISCSDGVSLMYQRVQRVECSSPRPVLVMGPLVEASKDMLVKETPAKFCRCLPGKLVYTDGVCNEFMFAH